MDAPTCRLIRAGERYVGKQGLSYLAGLTHDSAGSRAICMTFLTLPPGTRAKAHLHRAIETAIYVVDGEAGMYFGERLGEYLVARGGEYVYIPADMPHLVLNRSESDCRAVVAHTSPDDQEGIVLLPELEELL